MRKIYALLAVSLVIAAGCGKAPDGAARKAGINLGKQSAQITLTTGNNNDLVVPNHQGPTTFYRLLANASGSTLTGVDSTGASDGDTIVVRNDATSGNITITNADSSSLAANRILTPSAVSIVLVPKSAALLEWDTTAASWVASIAPTAGAAIYNTDLTVASTGHLKATGTAPTLSSCGSSPAPTITGSDVAGTIVTGGTATACTITFAATYGTAPSCILRPQGTATQPVYTTSATAISVTTDIATTTYDYICVGH